MTLIAALATKTRATLLTDTMSYLPMFAKDGRVSKVTLLPHLDAAYATQGDGFFAAAPAFQRSEFGDVADFDALLAAAPHALAVAWKDTLHNRAGLVAAGEDEDDSPVFAILAGYSPAHERYQVWQFASELDFAGQEQGGLFCYPSPLTHRVSDYELLQIQHTPGRQKNGLFLNEQTIDWWASRPPLPTPTTTHDWVQLGRAVRESRSMLNPRTGMKVFVGGELHHTTLAQGEQTTRRVHRFDDNHASAEFGRLAAGTMHPVGQALPCLCESGKAQADCHGYFGKDSEPLEA